MTLDPASNDREFLMEVRAYGLTADAEDALFDRVAEAAHELDEPVTCSGVSGPGNESCGLCKEPAAGFATVGERRYCHHGPSPTCYEVVQWRQRDAATDDILLQLDRDLAAIASKKSGDER